MAGWPMVWRFRNRWFPIDKDLNRRLDEYGANGWMVCAVVKEDRAFTPDVLLTQGGQPQLTVIEGLRFILQKPEGNLSEWDYADSTNEERSRLPEQQAFPSGIDTSKASIIQS